MIKALGFSGGYWIITVRAVKQLQCSKQEHGHAHTVIARLTLRLRKDAFLQGARRKEDIHSFLLSGLR